MRGTPIALGSAVTGMASCVRSPSTPHASFEKGGAASTGVISMDEITFFAKLDEYALAVVDATKVVYGISSAEAKNEFDARQKVAETREALWLSLSALPQQPTGD